MNWGQYFPGLSQHPAGPFVSVLKNGVSPHGVARARLAAYFEFYNTRRPHQALGFRTPAEVYVGRAESMASTEAALTSADQSTGHPATAGLKRYVAREVFSAIQHPADLVRRAARRL